MHAEGGCGTKHGHAVIGGRVSGEVALARRPCGAIAIRAAREAAPRDD
jgi:hypothetical protein